MSKFVVLAMPFFACGAPAGPPSVPTPFGHRPAHCVVEIPDGAIFSDSPEGVIIEHANGTRSTVVAHSDCHQDEVALRRASRASARAGSSRPQLRGEWLDNSIYQSQQGFSSFTGKYTIPADPQNTSNGVLYYFIGLVNWADAGRGAEENILQPVLGWRDSAWNLESWACCPHNISITSRNIRGLHTGQVVEAEMTRLDSSTWRVVSTVDGQSTTLTPRVGSYTYDYADVTLETYYIDGDCSKHSTDTFHFTDMLLKDHNGRTVQPSWSQPAGTECQGKTVIKDARNIDISHNGGGGPSPSPSPAPTPGPSPGCVDTESTRNCVYWKSAGYCDRSSQYWFSMYSTCCKTCGFGATVVV